MLNGMAQSGAARDAGQGHRHGHGYDGQGGQHHGQGTVNGAKKKAGPLFQRGRPGVQKRAAALLHLSYIIPLRA